MSEEIAKVSGFVEASSFLKAELDQLRSSISSFEDFLKKYLPEGRHKSIALTKLEECGMFAIKALALIK